MRWNVDVCDSAKNPLTYLFAPVALLETYGFSLTPNSYRVIYRSCKPLYPQGLCCISSEKISLRDRRK